MEKQVWVTVNVESLHPPPPPPLLQISVHYHVLPPFPTLIAAAGAHWANVSWLPLEYPDRECIDWSE